MEMRLLEGRDKEDMVEEVAKELMRECDGLDAEFTKMDAIMEDANANSNGAMQRNMDKMTRETRNNGDDISKWIGTLSKTELGVNTRMMGLMRDLKEFHKETIQQWTEEKKALLIAWFNKMKADREDVMSAHDRFFKNAPGAINRAATGVTNMGQSERLQQVAVREELIDAEFRKMKDAFEENADARPQSPEDGAQAPPPGLGLPPSSGKEDKEDSEIPNDGTPMSPTKPKMRCITQKRSIDEGKERK